MVKLSGDPSSRVDQGLDGCVPQTGVAGHYDLWDKLALVDLVAEDEGARRLLGGLDNAPRPPRSSRTRPD